MTWMRGTSNSVVSPSHAGCQASAAGGHLNGTRTPDQHRAASRPDRPLFRGLGHAAVLHAQTCKPGSGKPWTAVTVSRQPGQRQQTQCAAWARRRARSPARGPVANATVSPLPRCATSSIASPVSRPGSRSRCLTASGRRCVARRRVPDLAAAEQGDGLCARRPRVVYWYRLSELS